MLFYTTSCLIHYYPRLSYKHDKKDLYLWYSQRSVGSRWMISTSELYNYTGQRERANGYIWAETTSEVPSTGLEWKTKDGNTDVEARIECLDQGKSG